MLKLLQINCLDLFLFLDIIPDKNISDHSEEEWQSLTSSLRGNKPLDKTTKLAEALLETDADVISLNEVGGKESLENFNKYFLKDQFNVAIANGSSSRGIDTGFLVRKGIDYHIKGYDFIYDNGKKLKFSRTINKLTINYKNKSVINIFAVHFKSKRDGPNDHVSIETRYNETKGLIALIKKNYEKYKIPYIVSGDFNGNAGLHNRDFEFDALYEKTDLLDVHDIHNSSIQDRYSHIHFTKDDINYNQLDYIFLSKDLHALLLNTHRWLYKQDNQDTHVVTFSEKLNQPSDHYPQMASIDIKIK